MSGMVRHKYNDERGSCRVKKIVGIRQNGRAEYNRGYIYHITYVPAPAAHSNFYFIFLE